MTHSPNTSVNPVGGYLGINTNSTITMTGTMNEPTIIYNTESLRTFMSFLCDKNLLDMTTAVTSSIELLNYCVPARETVLRFYSELFSEYNIYYWEIRKKSGVTNEARVEYVGELTRRFFEMAKLKMADSNEDKASEYSNHNQSSSRARMSPTKSTSSNAGPASPTASQSCQSPTILPKIIPTGSSIKRISQRSSSCTSNDYEQTPMSPSAQDGPAEPENGVQQTEANSVNIFTTLEELISKIDLAISDLLQKHCSNNLIHATNPDDKLKIKLQNTLNTWASELLMILNSKHSNIALQASMNLNNDTRERLASEVELCLGNPVNKLLVNLILESRNNIQNLFKQLISQQNCDWLLAYLLLEMSKRPNYSKDFSMCMEYIIGYQTAVKSVTHILAYLSDANPRALTNFPKSNIPFLISLCQTSTSLLNVLAQEIPDTLNAEFLNNLAEEAYSRLDNQTHPPYIASLTHCIITAPNSYKLLLLTLEAKLDDKMNLKVKSAAQVIIDSILIKIHERSVDIINPPTNVLLLRPTLYAIDGLLEQINNDLSRLISKCTASKYLEKNAHEIFSKMSLIYGNVFASKVISHYLNLPENCFWQMLKPLLTKFMRQFGDDGSFLVSQSLSLDPKLRTSTYWNNLYALASLMPELKLNLDLLSQLLTDKLCAATFDIVSVAQLIKLCCNSLERVDHATICISTKHRLSMSLASCYFLLLEYESENFPEILSYIRISLTCMSLLKQSGVASHILCRALLERSMVYGHLFSANFNQDLVGVTAFNYNWSQDDYISLSKENLKVTLGHRFRRLPNQVPNRNVTSRKRFNGFTDETDAPDKYSINCYLLIEAFKSSIDNIEAFANLFVEFHCPVMFDKHSWPNDDALRVINEKNLSILRKFEQVPPLWDLYELIGQAGCLKNCLVLVKALLAAHLALWASATTNLSSDKMISTSRLIPPLAQSGLLPKAFELTVDVFPHLGANEVFSVLSDIWLYLKETNANGNIKLESLSPEEKIEKAKRYLNRLRLFMCQHMPGPLYVRIFKEFYTPVFE